MNENTRLKAQIVRKILDTYYEPERHDRCKLWVYRHHVRHLLPMSESTFWRYVARSAESAESERAEGGEDERQLRLF